MIFFGKRYINKNITKKETCIVVRGGGDLATGVIYKLWKSGYRVLALETEHPAAIRRQVSVCEAIYRGCFRVEDMEAVLIKAVKETEKIWRQGKVPLLIDPEGESIKILKPRVVVDGILAKQNLGTRRDMAELVIGMGPGFTAGEDVDIVVETMRGHNLGRLITEGTAQKNTGVPGAICGYTSERVIHASAEGVMRNVCKIGSVVEKGEVIAYLETEEGNVPVEATIPGIIRGLLKDKYVVTKGFKIADIDPRISELKNCFTISDKARCIAGAVLEAVCALE